jgi:hypothetical protein
MSEQKKSPKIEEVFNKHLTDESLKNGLDFIAKMRSSGFSFKGSPTSGWNIDCSYWWIYVQNKRVDDIYINKNNHTFHIDGDFENALQAAQSDFKEELFKYVLTCPRQNCKEPYCPNRKTNWELLGKTYDCVCKNPLRFYSTDAKALEAVYKIMLLYKQLYTKDDDKIKQEMEKWANSIIIKPDFPVRQGLPEDYPAHFEKLCTLLKEIYFDIAKDPEAYGMNNPKKLFDFFSCLTKFGVIENNQLFVNVENFKKEAKKSQSATNASLTKSELIMSKLSDFGFVFTPFDGKPFGKDVAEFTVEYPDYPQMLETIKQYYDCWRPLYNNPYEFKGQYLYGCAYRNAYKFCYLIAADLEKMTIPQCFGDILSYKRLPQNVNEFQKAFYEYSLRYGDIRYDEHYYYKKSKLMIFDSTWGHEPLLHIKIRKMNGYTSEIEKMPEAIRELFSKDRNNCRICKETCGSHVSWVFEGQKRVGCSENCFTIDNFDDLSLIPHYWRLVELDCKLKVKE